MFHSMQKQQSHSWRNVYYYIKESLVETPNISCKDLFESVQTQHHLRKLLHNWVKDDVYKKFEQIYNDITENQ